MIFWTLKAFEGEEFARLNEAQADFLSAAEKQRLSELKFPKRRMEWLRGRWLAKQLLCQIFGGGSSLFPQDLTIANDALGAPYVATAEGKRLAVALSVSHRDHLAFCAVTTDVNLRVGVDVERIEPRSEAFIRDYFTPNEIGAILSQPPALQACYAALFWSAKEAALKALGIGLRMDTHKIEVSLGGEASLHVPRESLWQPLGLQSAEHASWHTCWQRRGDYILTVVSMV